MVEIESSTEAFSFEIVSLTDPGKLRTLNEDRVTTDSDSGVLVLADGMGGYKAGEIASSIVTETVIAELRAQRLHGKNEASALALVRKVIEYAGRRVFAESKRRAETPGSHPNQTMGATLAMLALHGHRAIIAHVGDSRVYRLRNGALQLLTRDHSLLQEQLDRGDLGVDAAAQSHNRHLVTRGLGLADSVEIAMQQDTPKLGDIYLLCSDGLNDMVDDDEIELVLNAVGVNLPLAARQLVMIANDAGGEDNISVILARVRPAAASASRGTGFMAWFRASLARIFGR
jgi:PPM family protein phosphatase